MDAGLGLGNNFYEMQAQRALEQGKAAGLANINSKNLNNDQKAGAVAKELESVFLTEMMKNMWEGVKPDKTFGGGSTEEIYRGFMLEEYGKQMAGAGGVGLQQAIKQQILTMQAQQKNGGKLYEKGL